MATAAENKLIKRRNILDAAWHLFTTHSFAETAIDDVVRLAGVAKGTFYLYFRDKYDLLDQIIIRRTAEILTEGCALLRNKAKQTAMSSADQIIFLTDYIASYLQKNKKVTALIDKRFSACLTDSILQENEEFSDAFSYLTGILTNAQRTIEEAKRTLYVVLNMVGSVLCDSLLTEHPYSLDEILPTLHLMLRGALNRGETA